MRHVVTSMQLAVCLAVLSAGPAFAQAAIDDAQVRNGATAAPSAHVYIQTTKGVNVYATTSTGKTTLVQGSPFATVGQMEGVNGKFLLSVGNTYLHSYALGSNGSVGKETGTINTQLYGGSECGTTSANGMANGAILDHTGKYLMVHLFGSTTHECEDGWQSYAVGSNGQFTFLDSLTFAGHSNVPTVGSNNKYVYGVDTGEGACVNGQIGNWTDFTAMQLDANGMLQSPQYFAHEDPIAQTGAEWYYTPVMNQENSIQADPTGNLAVLMYSMNGPCGTVGAFQLASYNIDANSTIEAWNPDGNPNHPHNTWQNMPVPRITNPTGISMSTSGKLLAVFGNPGLQLFNFNGAQPITPNSAVLLPTVKVDQVAWDRQNHLFALSYKSSALHVFTATPSSLVEVAGSPFSVRNAYGIEGMIVVPK